MQRLDHTKFSEEAAIRLRLEGQVKVSLWYKTLFSGLTHNHPHNIAVVHPLAFVLRRVLYAVLITTAQQESVLFCTLALQFTCLFMMAMVWSEIPWDDALIN